MNYKRCTSGRKGRIVLLEPLPDVHAGDQWEELAQAIILQAAEDYRNALKGMQEEPEKRKHLKRKTECEHFFRSEWFRVLSKVNPDMIPDRIRKEMET